MQFNLAYPAIFIISLFSLAEGCVKVFGNISNLDKSKPQDWLTINLVDNGVERCRWSGVWPKDKPQGMNCNPGFAAWFQLGTAYGETGVMAYSTGNGKNNFRFGVRVDEFAYYATWRFMATVYC